MFGCLLDSFPPVQMQRAMTRKVAENQEEIIFKQRNYQIIYTLQWKFLDTSDGSSLMTKMDTIYSLTETNSIRIVIEPWGRFRSTVQRLAWAALHALILPRRHSRSLIYLRFRLVFQYLLTRIGRKCSIILVTLAWFCTYGILATWLSSGVDWRLYYFFFSVDARWLL